MLTVLLFFGSYISGFVLAFVSSPMWAFLVYQIVYFMDPHGRWWSYMVPSLSYSFYTVMLMFAMLVKSYQDTKANRLLAVPQFRWIYAIVFLYLLTLFYAVWPAQNRYEIINLIKLVVTMSVAYKLIDSNRKLDGTLAAFIAGAAYIGYLTHQVGRNSGDRVEGIGTVDSPDSNGIAAAIAPTVVLCLYYFWIAKSKWIKFANVVAGAFIANALVLINSRGSFLAVLGSLGYFMLAMLFSRHRRPRQRAAAIGLICLALLAGSIIVDPTALARFHSIDQQKMTEQKQTGATRVYFWLAALKMSKDYPFGGGASAFEFNAPRYLPVGMASGFSRHRAVHSSWFQALTEIGYPGLICMIMLLFSCYRATTRCKSVLAEDGDLDAYYKVVAIEAALFAYIIAMSFMNRFKAEVFYWCILFTACAYNVYVLKRDSAAGIDKRSERPDPKVRKRPRLPLSYS